jgi:hypothetical protein
MPSSPKSVHATASSCLRSDQPVHAAATTYLSSITIHAINISQISSSASSLVENAGSSDPDNDFRFDATMGSTGEYIFNLKTTGLSTGTYSLNFTVTGDSFVYGANFEVK